MYHDVNETKRIFKCLNVHRNMNKGIQLYLIKIHNLDTQKYLSKQIRGSCMCANVWMNES